MELERTSAVNVGLSEELVRKYIDGMEKEQIHSYMIEKDGKVIAEGAVEPYSLTYSRSLYSLTKTISVMALGFLLENKKISLDDELYKFFPEYESRCTNGLIHSCHVRDLLTMQCGMPCKNSDHDFYEAPDWLEELFTGKPEHEPGTYFEYDNRCAYTLSAIVTRVTGKSVYELLNEKVFLPMDIHDVIWETDKKHVSQGGWGMSTTLETVAKLGRLLLNEGKWNGIQLLNREWVNTCLSVQVNTSSLGDYNKKYGYGYQIWAGKPENVWLARGAFGQLCILCKNQNTVISMFSGLQNYNAVLDLTWKFIESIDQMPKRNEISETIWKANENALGLETFSIKSGAEDIVRMKVNGSVYEFKAGHESWSYNELPIEKFSPMTEVFWKKALCKASWVNEKYILNITFVESPYHDTMIAYRNDDKLQIDYICSPQIRIRGKEYHIYLEKENAKK